MKSIGDQINATFVPTLTPLADLYLQGGYQGDLPTGNKSYVIIFGIVGLFILVLASINYMNMATARSVSRAREVGIRKVSGAHRGQLIAQFLTESLLMVVIALVVALLLVQLLMPEFNLLTGKMLKLDLFNSPLLLMKLVGMALLVGIVSGSYPAFYLSSFEPVEVIKGSTTSGGKSGGFLRKALVVFQFWIAIVMIIGTIVVNEQLRYIRSKDIGFEKQNVVFVQMQDTSFRNRHESFKQALLQNPHIIGASNTTGMVGLSLAKTVMRVETEEGWAERVLMNLQADHDFTDLMGMRIIEGRSFDRNQATDREEATLINETAVRQLGWTGEALGKRIHMNFDPSGEGGRVLKVVGVVKDFHASTLHNEVEPFLIAINENPGLYMAIRINASQQRLALDHIEDQWHKFGAGRPFDYKLLNDQLDSMYENEEKTARLFIMAALLTIFIALLGLLGLSSYVAEQRTREIGIRKILGATDHNLAALFYRSFIWLILLSYVLAAPFAWWRLSQWLEQTFVYHIQIGATTFVLAGLAALLSGVLAVSYHLVRVLRNNPVEVIQYE
jgi:putative ABC transport system permease protein